MKASRLKLYINKISFPARKDLIYISFVFAVWLLVILWESFEGFIETKLVFSLCIWLAPFYLIVNLIPSKGLEGEKIVKKRVIDKDGVKDRFSFVEGSLIVFAVFFAAAFLTGQYWMLLFAFGILLGGSIYEAVLSGKWRKVKVFFRKVYLSSGLLPYFLSLFTVAITWLLFGIFEIHAPEFLHYRFKPFGSDFKVGMAFGPLLSLKEFGFIFLLMGLLVVLILVPYLTYEEERLFRYKRISFWEIIRGALIFGPVHVISGLPLYACIVFIFIGIMFSLFYTYNYRHLLKQWPLSPKRASFAALFPVTTLHAIHNSLNFIAFVALMM